MKRLLLPLLMTSMACTQATPSAPVETAQRRDAVLTDAQIGNAWKDPPLPYRTVSFTFDDGPDDNPMASFNTSWQIAKYLQQQGIRATFFINGCRIDAGCPRYLGDLGNTTYLSQIVEMGHRVANHTYDHEALTNPSLGAAGQIAELKVNQAILDPYITDGMFLFRAPGDNWGQSPIGETHACDGSSSIANNVRSDPALSKMSGPFCFDWDAHDWACTNNGWTPEACADHYVAMSLELDPDGDRTVNGLERGIIQMHDFNPTMNIAGTDWAYRFVVSLVGKLKAVSGTPYVFVPLDAHPGVRGMFSFPAPTQWTTTYLSDWETWNSDVGYYGTVRLGDINGDGKADVCGRGSGGIRCALSLADGSMDTATNWLSLVADTDGYKPAQYSTTFQLADIDNDGNADACIRAVVGYLCFKSNGTTAFATSAWDAAEFSNANGWNASEALYGSIRIGNVDGDLDGYADICGRNAAGEIVCSLFNGTTFEAATSWSSDFTAPSWALAKHATTFQLADLDNDGKADICARGADGMWCGLSEGVATGFATASRWTQMSFDDAQGWGTLPSRYKSIKLGDVDGDGKADVCGRHSTGLVCSFSTGTSFRNYRYVTNMDFGDSEGWSADEYGSTLALGDVNGDGRADLCARASAGLTCTLAPMLLATYNTTRQTGLCSTAQASCDSGMFYEGRGTVYPEAQQPNTLQGTCADGSAVTTVGTDVTGGYLKDGSVERVRVMTLDKTPFASGKTVRVEVSAFASGTGEQLEIFTAANAASPTWVSLGATTLSSAGYAWVTRTYTLPAGAQQAVRAVLRSTSLSGACPGGGFTDVDDLAFTVQ
ncbi:FG-GAP-like repeat-containing protein [Myxococcus sp. CA039A]|uniref:FG-GAP-like repeat-containing protein n=1 Tax=Myxococcus sp. CA039A TaxID=2741737 RepID=UPI00157AB060|nr:FG-GAP-like repeat-containing protein [Myxococcus sp. CA039A]NTX57335.1 VCBS repeat-containing protein [Myxococcus sp. CA039A]